MTDNLFLSYDMPEALYALGVLRRLDLLFARFIAVENSAGHSREIGILAGLVSYSSTVQENVCLDLNDPLGILTGENHLFSSDQERKKFDSVCADIRQLLSDLDYETIFRKSNVVAVSPVCGVVAYPLVYHDGKLYLQRYWQAETAVIEYIKQHRDTVADFNDNSARLVLEDIYSRFTDPVSTYWQQVAVFAALRNRLTFITGGPGTGKTTVVAVIVALLLQGNPDLDIVLVAPTGKAQARLQEAVLEELTYLQVSAEVKERIRSLSFMTIHRLLGLGKRRRKLKSEVNHDLIIVDEASMISILLFEKLFGSLRRDTRLIFLGDREQLASVEGGAVLSDICTAAGELETFSEDFCQKFSCVMPENLPDLQTADSNSLLSDLIVPLKHTFRFAADSGIGKMKELLSQDDTAELEVFLTAGNARYASSFALHSFRTSHAMGVRSEILDFLGDWQCEGIDYFSCFSCATLAEAFSRFSRFQIITPVNSGVTGVEGINSILLSYLNLKGKHKRGLPVMITENDYQTGLFNGDIGMYWEDSAGDMKVWFPDFSSGDSAFNAYSPAQLPANIPAFAMTVHKSQGSGFDSVLLIVPEVQMSISSKELLYTAVTRAKKKIDVFAGVDSLLSLSVRTVCRYSGIAGRLRE